MTQLTGQERAAYVQNMFTQIAKRYDLMNRLMTGFQDVRWRKQVIRLARLTNNASLLDLGTGTGDLAREALTQFPRSQSHRRRFHARNDARGTKDQSAQLLQRRRAAPAIQRLHPSTRSSLAF